MTDSQTIPDAFMKAARDTLMAAITAARSKTADEAIELVAKAIHDAVMAERERCARLIEEGYERGIASKRDRCAHSKFEWEDCDECAVAAIRATPKAEG
jgi:hypothetical protein